VAKRKEKSIKKAYGNYGTPKSRTNIYTMENPGGGERKKDGKSKDIMTNQFP
jgi:hypothetical protein